MRRAPTGAAPSWKRVAPFAFCAFCAFCAIVLAACAPSTAPRQACEVKCPEGSQRAGKDCVALDARVRCPEGSTFRSGGCVPAVRTAMVDIQRIIETTSYAKRQKDSLKADFERKQKALDQSQERLLAEKKAIETGKMSDAAKRTRILKYEKELGELQKTYVSFQKEIRDKEQAIVTALIEKIRQIATEVAEREGFEVVFVERDVLWAKTGANAEKLRGIPRDDLTDAVARQLDNPP